MNRCIDCKRWNLRDSGQMARLGFGQCEVKQKGHYTSLRARECDKFTPCGEDIAAKRVAWLDKQKG